jgi:nucleoside-diphosphate-sugar epimerase
MISKPDVSFSHRGKDSYGIERVLVIGKTGFVGSELLLSLEAIGIKAVGIGREDVDLTSPLAVTYLADIVRDLDIVVFASADVPVKSLEQFERNLSMLRNFLDGVKGKKLSQLVYISSDGVFADSQQPLTENSPRGAENLHGLMHMVREVALQSSEFKKILCIARPTIIYGAKDPHNSYGPCSFMRLVNRAEEIVLFGNGEEERDFIHISDVAAIVTNIIQSRSTGAFNLATGEVHSFFDIAELTQEIARSKSLVLSKPRVGAMPHNGYRPFDITNLKLAFPEFSPLTLNEGLNSMYNGY